MIKKLDKKDYEILRAMIILGTKNSKKLAQYTNITDKTIRNRIAKYQENKIFKEAILINANFFGYSIKADFFIKVQKNIKSQQIIDYLINNYKHNILYLGYHWSENDDISIQVIFHNTKEIHNFKQKLQQHPLITSIKMIIVPMVIKDTYEWMPDQNNFSISTKELSEIEKRRNQEKTTKSDS